MGPFQIQLVEQIEKLVAFVIECGVDTTALARYITSTSTLPHVSANTASDGMRFPFALICFISIQLIQNPF